MIGKLIVSQVFGIAAAILANMVCAEIVGVVPFYVPLGTWLLTSLYVLAKL